MLSTVGGVAANHTPREYDRELEGRRVSRKWRPLRSWRGRLGRDSGDRMWMIRARVVKDG
jgi:hypothetical protein